MTEFSMLPASAAEREAFLAELRCQRLALLQAVYYVDFIGSVQHHVVTTDGGKAMLNEMLESTSEGTATSPPHGAGRYGKLRSSAATNVVYRGRP